MAKEIEVKIPDIGGASGVDVIEIMVKAGDRIEVDSPLITLESDKASMEIPSPCAGIISKVSVNIGDKVAEGDTILLVKTESESPSSENAPNKNETIKEVAPAQIIEETQPVSENTKVSLQKISIPDIGGATEVDVIDVLVKPGMTVEKDQALITLEGDKATMDIPSPYAGIIKEVLIHIGDKAAQGTSILTLETSDLAEITAVRDSHTSSPLENTKKQEELETPVKSVSSERQSIEHNDLLSAGPAVRRMARELGVNLNLIKGTGRKTRITREDVQDYIKAQLNQKSSGNNSLNIPASPVVDFSKFGEIELKPLNKIKKLTGINVHRSWITIPHVTQFDEADITELEAFRKTESTRTNDSGYKLTLLAFVCRVVSKALQVYPQFNASLDASGDNLVFKKYCNIGIAVETPNGLVVPVIKNVPHLSVVEIAAEMGRLSSKARDKGLMPADMSGGCFTISSLGGIGGTAFTPIVNSPEVAILGLSRASIKPVYDGKEFKPRLMLPMSLSYDHRVIDGAEAARFTNYISECLSDIRRVLL
ncbi:MAG TPA: dihydrolipoyllysine-residue acetyltransferase [Legionella sp.]|nr:dihydrolipoyllysine-residue acetyltransferase [Legionella sp.]